MEKYLIKLDSLKNNQNQNSLRVYKKDLLNIIKIILKWIIG